MIERVATVQNEMGIHCRPSATIIMEMSRYSGRLEIVIDEGSTDLRSLLALVALGLSKGTRVVIRVAGPDEERICGRLVELFETHFDFPTLSPAERPGTLARLLAGAGEGSDADR